MRCLLISLVLVLSAGVAEAADLQRMLDATVRISNLEREPLGSGVFIKEYKDKYYVLTNAHVAGVYGDVVRVEGYLDGRPQTKVVGEVIGHRADVIANPKLEDQKIWDFLDVAIVSVKKKDLDYTPVLANLVDLNTEYKPDTKLYAAGCPNGLSPVIQQVRAERVHQNVISYWPNLKSGSSGGPLFNEAGEVYALTFSGSAISATAIKATAISQAWDPETTRYQQCSNGSCSGGFMGVGVGKFRYGQPQAPPRIVYVQPQVALPPSDEIVPVRPESENSLSSNSACQCDPSEVTALRRRLEELESRKGVLSDEDLKQLSEKVVPDLLVAIQGDPAFKGEKGEQGPPGKDGENGKDGASAVLTDDEIQVIVDRVNRGLVAKISIPSKTLSKKGE